MSLEGLSAQVRYDAAMTQLFPFRGRCVRCHILDSIGIDYVCPDCLYEQLNKLPNVHGEGEIPEEEENA